MDNPNSINQTATIASTTNVLAAATSQASFVPYVPIAISTTLVATHVLAKRLVATVPELAHLSLADFASIQLKKSELQLKADECTVTYKALLDICLLNVQDLFSSLSAYLLTLGQTAETSDYEKLQTNLQASLKQIHAYADSMNLAVADYCVDDVIFPEMLFDCCLKRIQLLQKQWQNHCFQAIELSLQLQKDAIFGAVAACLTEICQHGLDNQITLEPTPLAQEDVLVALASFVDAPFAGEWPALREKVKVLGSEGGVQ
jgi:hypothetical protein